MLLSPLHPPPSCIAQHGAAKTWDVLGGKGLEGTQLGAAQSCSLWSFLLDLNSGFSPSRAGEETQVGGR